MALAQSRINMLRGLLKKFSNAVNTFRFCPLKKIYLKYFTILKFLCELNLKQK